MAGSEVEFEDILELVGGYGKYQKHLTAFFLIPVFCILPCFWLNFLFMVSVPDHWCHVPELEYSNLTLAQKRGLVSPPENPKCAMYERNYTWFGAEWNSTVDRNAGKIVPCLNGWEFDKTNYDRTASMKFDLVCDHDHYPSLLFTLSSVGSLVTTPGLGGLSDKYGRKVVFVFLALLVSVTELLSVLVNDFILFAVLRTLNGTVFPTMFMLPYILISEIVSPDMRAHMNGVVNFSWTFGLCVLPLVAYLARDWVVLGFLSAGFGSSLMLYYRFFPESPSWLVSRGRLKEAADIVLKIGEKNGRPQNPVHVMSMLRRFGEKIEKMKVEEKNASGWKLLKYPRMRKNFFILSFCWATFYVAYGGLTYNVINLSGNEFLNFFWLSLVEVPGNLIFWVLMDRCGRRWTSAVGFLLMGLTSLIPLIGFQYADIVGSAAGKMISSGLYMVADQQGVELFPTAARSFCIGSGKTLATGTALASPYLAYLSLYGGWIPFLVISVVSFVSGGLATFLPETLNQNLPQTVTESEEFGRDQKFFSWRSSFPNRNVKSVNNQNGGVEFKETEAEV